MMEAANQTPCDDPVVSQPAPANPREPDARMTERQIEAVYAVMRLLRNDTPPASLPAIIVCDRCRRERPGHGSVTYGASLLCNGCATDYELLRVARSVHDIEDFLRAPLSP